jgi:hypothetical protein
MTAESKARQHDDRRSTPPKRLARRPDSSGRGKCRIKAPDDQDVIGSSFLLIVDLAMESPLGTYDSNKVLRKAALALIGPQDSGALFSLAQLIKGRRPHQEQAS